MVKRICSWIRKLTLIGFASLVPLSTHAHDYWLEPDHFQVQPGQAIQLKLYLGQGFQVEKEKPLQPERTSSLELHASPHRRLNLLNVKNAGKSPVATFSIAKPGARLVSMERTKASISFGRAKFYEYLEHEKIDPTSAPWPEGRRSVKEDYQRSLKTLLQCGTKSAGAAVMTTKQSFQVVPLSSPYQLPLPKQSGFKVLFQGKPLVGARVEILHRHAGKITSEWRITDARGVVRIHLIPEGRWLVRGVHLQPAQPGSDADWQSWWTALTFGYD